MNSKTNGETDEDCLFLEQVLDKLYDFGNGSKKKNQKKKKRKRCEEEEEQQEEEEEEEVSLVKNGGGSDAAGVRVKDVVVTEAEQTGPKTQQRSQVEVVTFQDPRKKQKTKPAPVADKESATEKTQSDQSEELSLEKARLEVHWFGITGYKKEQQRVLEQNRAVMLGAKPPKKEYVNYKILQQQIKEKKQKKKEEAQPNKKKQSTQRDKKTKTASSSASAPLGQVGRFKNGMLILSSKEIQKIKGTKRRK